MAVITVDEVKVLLQISDTTKDDLIEMLIPQAEYIITGEVNKDYSASWPVGMKVPASMIIADLMNSMASGGGLTSESQGGYSYTRDGGAVGLSKSVKSLLAQWRVARTHFAKPSEVSRDRRGQSIDQLANGDYFTGIEGTVIED